MAQSCAELTASVRAMQNFHCPLPLSGLRVNPPVLVPSWDRTVPPSAVGLTSAATVKSAPMVTAGPEAFRRPVPVPAGTGVVVLLSVLSSASGL